jgi:transketolase
MFAAANKVDNYIATIDYNGRQIDGDVENVLSLGNLKAKFEAFGWIVVETNDGNNIEEVINGLTIAKNYLGKGKPVVNIMKTEMGAGVDFMLGSHKWHGVAPNDEQLNKALLQLEETLGDY